MRVLFGRKRKWRLLKLITMLIACVGALSIGFEPVEAQETPKYGGTLVVAIGQGPANLNPTTTNAFYTKMVSSPVYNTLVRLDFNFNPVPLLARSWVISPDGKTYTFNLVETKWHDGEPFTSEDVKFSFEEMLMKNHPGGGIWKDKIKEIRTPNPRTVIFELNTPFPAFFVKNAYDSYIIPKHLFQGTDIFKNPYSMKPIGTGAFKFVEWVKGSHIRLERNTNYFNPKLPYLEGILFKIMPDPGTRMVAFERGEIDYLSFYILPPSEVSRLKKMSDVVITSKGHEIFGDILTLDYNLDNPPLNNLLVRKAIAHSIDKQYIIEKADYGLGKVATGPLASVVTWAYTSDVPKYPYNLELANKLLDEAGYPKKTDGVRFRLTIRYDRAVPILSKTGEILREQLRPVGIDLELNPGDIATTLEMVFKQRKFDLLITGRPSGSDPAISLPPTFSSENVRPVPYSNAAGYKNPVIDDLFEKGARLIDPIERAKIYHQIQKILVTDLPAIWIEEYGKHSAWRNEFIGLHTWSSLSSYTLEDVWWTKGKSK